jgi:putative SOS response-associated peptidase YedK
MCGRFASWSDKNEILKHYGLKHAPDYYAGYNIYPTRDILAVRRKDKPEIVNMYWGYLPAWCKDKKYEVANCRDDKILAKSRFYADSFKNRRCLIPVNGYFEWHQTSKPKQPFFIKLKDQDIFSFAGIWDTWETSHGPREGCAIITAPPPEQIENIHHRAAVIIKPKDYDEWLEEGGEKFLKPYKGKYQYWPVSTRVNTPKNQGLELIERVPWPSTVPQWEQ